MAMIKCPECGKDASDMAGKCPNCGYPFAQLAKDENVYCETAELKSAVADTKAAEKKKWIVPLAILLAVAAIACAVTAIIIKRPTTEALPAADEEKTVETEAVSQKKEKRKNKNGSYEEIVDADVQEAIGSITEEFNAIAEQITDYDSYKENYDKVGAWYTLCLEQSEKLYSQLAEDTYGEYMKIADTGLKEYDEWHDMLSDSYDIWNDAMRDYYRAWNDLYEDAYRLFDDAVSDGYDVVSYDEAADAWEDMYDMYSDSWEDMYDMYSDAWEDLYDLHSDVFSEFYDGNTDIKEVYEKIFAKD